jgi:hypothetical protein
MKTQTDKGVQEKKTNGTQKKNPVQKSSTKVDELLNPTAEGRIKKLENFNLLVKKHKFLNEKNDELQKFIISSDGTKEKIILENAQGFKFEVSNSQVVEKVLDVVSTELETFTKASEKEVLAFSI